MKKKSNFVGHPGNQGLFPSCLNHTKRDDTVR